MRRHAKSVRSSSPGIGRAIAQRRRQVVREAEVVGAVLVQRLASRRARARAARCAAARGTHASARPAARRPAPSSRRPRRDSAGSGVASLLEHPDRGDPPATARAQQPVPRHHPRPPRPASAASEVPAQSSHAAGTVAVTLPSSPESIRKAGSRDPLAAAARATARRMQVPRLAIAERELARETDRRNTTSRPPRARTVRSTWRSSSSSCRTESPSSCAKRREGERVARSRPRSCCRIVRRAPTPAGASSSSSRAPPITRRARARGRRRS